jgi:hypothetical protein
MRKSVYWAYLRSVAAGRFILVSIAAALTFAILALAPQWNGFGEVGWTFCIDLSIAFGGSCPRYGFGTSGDWRREVLVALFTFIFLFLVLLAVRKYIGMTWKQCGVVSGCYTAFAELTFTAAVLLIGSETVLHSWALKYAVFGESRLIFGMMAVSIALSRLGLIEWKASLTFSGMLLGLSLLKWGAYGAKVVDFIFFFGIAKIPVVVTSILVATIQQRISWVRDIAAILICIVFADLLFLDDLYWKGGHINELLKSSGFSGESLFLRLFFVDTTWLIWPVVAIARPRLLSAPKGDSVLS